MPLSLSKKLPFACTLASLLYLLFYTASNLSASSSESFPTSTEDPFGGYRFFPEDVVPNFKAPNEKSRNYHEWNDQTLRELHMCLERNDCGPNQRKVALLAAHWFEEAIVRGWRGGEGVWSLSMYKHLRAMGYTTLFANSFEEALAQYRMFPDLVQVVVRNRAGECHADSKCVKGPSNPDGIPAWKIFDFEYFPNPEGGHYHASLMKGKWILSANPDKTNDTPLQYIGFSMEDECLQRPAKPLAERSHRIWVLMKQLTYVYDGRFAWNRSFFSTASSTDPSSPIHGVPFTGAWIVDQHYQWKPELQGIMEDIEDREHGVVNLLSRNDALAQNKQDGEGKKGRMGPDEWEREVGNSKVMIGVGNPWMSPSPYHALCLGVPFLNPILNWDPRDKWNKAKWHTQHPSLNRYDPPFVYHVHKSDYPGFVNAIHSAINTEIPSFIPRHMTEVAVRNRVRHLMEHDWKEEAKKVLLERLGDGYGYTFEL
ncbi:hypothetical protein CPB83DRAFT_905608 [Crepidotus variabilis]|uniref:Glycosyltransferase family 18 catalytic domain-containing protein n=1 Tax=Crepidotus variabilis TaxID=179855 RepID=A0A9P6JR89_9AGAR|nr:hypothetical protein CPB83DRAFT_905608 [Crepidotus variabilis]